MPKSMSSTTVASWYVGEPSSRRSVDALEAVAERRPHLAVPVGALALAHRPFVPRDAEPLEVGDDRLLPARDVARRIGVVDAQEHPVAEPPVRDRAERVADVERARRARRKADSDGIRRV